MLFDDEPFAFVKQDEGKENYNNHQRGVFGNLSDIISESCVESQAVIRIDLHA